MFFYHFSPIKKQIDQYVAWKAIRYPMAAEEHRRVLTEFFQKMRLPCVTKIGQEHIRAYAERFSSTYQREKFMKVIRGFCKYWYIMGILTARFESIVQHDIIEDMADIHPLLHTERVREVHKLKRNNPRLTFRQIQTLMETKHKRKFDIKQVYHWYIRYTSEGKLRRRVNLPTKRRKSYPQRSFDAIPLREYPTNR